MRRVVIALMLLVAGAVQAQSALVGKRLISRGDDVARVRGIGIKPDRIDRIEADEHSPAMDIWTYRQGSRAIAVWMVDGKVVQVQEQELPPPAASAP